MFLRIFDVWSSIKLTYSRKDTTLHRDAFLIGGCILTSAILENVVLNLENIEGLDSINGTDFQLKSNFTLRQHANLVSTSALVILIFFTKVIGIKVITII